MKRALRAIAAFNAAFQGIVGLLCVVAPATAMGLFGVTSTGAGTFALTRMFGGLLVASGVVSAAVARDPDVPALRVVLVAGCVVNVTSDVVVCVSGDMGLSQLAGGMLLQALVVIAAVVAPRQRPLATRSVAPTG